MILLKLDGVDGDSNIPGYEKWISCTSVSWNVERTFSESAKAGTQDVNLGVAEIPPISINKTFDTASVYLMQSAHCRRRRWAAKPRSSSSSRAIRKRICTSNSSSLTRSSRAGASAATKTSGPPRKFRCGTGRSGCSTTPRRTARLHLCRLQGWDRIANKSVERLDRVSGEPALAGEQACCTVRLTWRSLVRIGDWHYDSRSHVRRPTAPRRQARRGPGGLAAADSRQPGRCQAARFLFQLLAVQGQWDRALTQLNMAGEMDAAHLAMVQTYREAFAASFCGPRFSPASARR